MQVHVKNVEKVNEQILKKWCHQDTDRWADRQGPIYRTFRYKKVTFYQNILEWASSLWLLYLTQRISALTDIHKNKEFIKNPKYFLNDLYMHFYSYFCITHWKLFFEIYIIYCQHFLVLLEFFSYYGSWSS